LHLDDLDMNIYFFNNFINRIKRDIFRWPSEYKLRVYFFLILMNSFKLIYSYVANFIYLKQ